MPLLVGVWEIGRLVNVHQLMMNAAREAGRQAATGEKTKEDIGQIVLTYLKNNGMHNITALAADAADLQSGGKVLLDIKVYDVEETLVADADPKWDAEQHYRLEVSVVVLYKDVEYR